ncbi:MAG: metallophosphoesterase, partial [Actinomycetota bacterium]
TPTADLIRRIDPDVALTLGDNQYDDGTLAEYLASYDHAWGTFKDITFPVAGNHDWESPNAQGFLDYFHLEAYWYSFLVGHWRLYALDGTCSHDGGCDEGDPQYEWLKDKLASRSDRCILAYWHQPRFSSGTAHGSATDVGPLWDLLYGANSDLVLNGHEHNYERFAPQDPQGRPAADGIVEIVAGTGGNGEGSYPFGDPIANSEVRLNGLGAVELRLWGHGWAERYLRPSGQAVDSASGNC